ncbi:methyl-accepting chemotaxis protein [Crassaminicella profunda]|uniref:methyl-accepting chemotaxis protein n=1 Tax=Crassaminicella profunda TaxID=1286698 RepID=UPI001CA70FA6|nr:methyl-accepting chemotaxis protein [Crassaminicella profunda]QZY57244.1 hypothetical protein K7H06_10125 [Crassaminicella profunda]
MIKKLKSEIKMKINFRKLINNRKILNRKLFLRKVNLSSIKHFFISYEKSPIHKKIFRAFISLILLILFVSIITNFSLHITSSNLTKIENLIHHQLMLSSKLQVYTLQTNILFQRYLTGNNSINDVKKKLQEIDTTNKAFLLSFNEHKDSIIRNHILKEIESFQDICKRLEEYTNQLPTTFLDAFEATKDMHVLLSLDRLKKMDHVANKINTDTIQYTKPIIQDIHQQNNIYSRVSILMGLISVALSLYFVISITTNVKSFRHILHQLTKKLVTETDEVLEISNNLKGDASHSSEHLLSTSNHINFFLSESDEIGACVDEVSNGISHVSQLNQELTYSSHSMIEFVNQTQNTIYSFDNKLKDDVKHIHHIIDNLNKNLLQITHASDEVFILSDKINNIQSILTSITNISKKTNLLAINASIEAAHAGEFGRGFTIVAEEIRELANQSSQNTLQIKNIINELIEFSTSTISTLRKSTHEASVSIEGTKEIITTFDTISNIFLSIIHDIENIKNLTLLVSNNSSTTNSKAEQIKIYSHNIAAKIQSFLSSIQDFGNTLIKITDTTKTSLNGIHHQFELIDEQKKNIENIYRTVKKL